MRHARTHSSRDLWVALLFVLFCGTSISATAQEDFCGITPQSARSIAAEVIKQAGHPCDSVSAAYYVSVMASRLSPYYVVYFLKDSMVVGVMEVDMCGRQGTPHPGIQYSADSDLRFDRLLLEPDDAFRVLRARTGTEPAFATRIFPFGLVEDANLLSTIEFWWMILDTRGRWHYMTREGEFVGIGTPAPLPGQR